LVKINSLAIIYPKTPTYLTLKTMEFNTFAPVEIVNPSPSPLLPVVYYQPLVAIPQFVEMDDLVKYGKIVGPVVAKYIVPMVKEIISAVKRQQ
jgi:hypothetical protein